jgi:hypothetical protein
LDTYLGKHAGERVLRGLVRRGDGEDIHAVIWFCDLRDSTAMADSMPRPTFLGILNDFFDCTAGAVLDHRGEVLRYIGDAALAIFPTGTSLCGVRRECCDIRDKIAASKRKGLWMGRISPLGYDVENWKLVANAKEAKTVRHIFERFVELGSSTRVVKELRLDGVTSKSWTTQEGRVREGKPIDKCLIYKVLSNRVYLGEIRHREQWYPGEHPPLVERELWDAVQAILARNPRGRGQRHPRQGTVPAEGAPRGQRRTRTHPLVHPQEERAPLPLLSAGA